MFCQLFIQRWSFKITSFKSILKWPLSEFTLLQEDYFLNSAYWIYVGGNERKFVLSQKMYSNVLVFLMQRLQKFWHDNSICDHSTCHDFASSCWSRIWIAHYTKPCIVIIPSFVHAYISSHVIYCKFYSRFCSGELCGPLVSHFIFSSPEPKVQVSSSDWNLSNVCSWCCKLFTILYTTLELQGQILIKLVTMLPWLKGMHVYK